MVESPAGRDVAYDERTIHELEPACGPTRPPKSVPTSGDEHDRCGRQRMDDEVAGKSKKNSHETWNSNEGKESIKGRPD